MSSIPTIPAGPPFPRHSTAELLLANQSNSPPNITVGIWGPRAAGKTMYFYALDFQLSAVAEHLKVWTMAPKNAEASELLKDAAKTIDSHLFPVPTRRDVPVSCVFEFVKRQARGTDTLYRMDVMDWSGEIYTKPGNYGEQLLAYLGRCTGLLCLIDPNHNPNEPFMAYLVSLLYDLQTQKQVNHIDTRIAFCLTKMDEPRHRRWRGKEEQYIVELLGEPLIKKIKSVCASGNFRFNFGCSAVGFYPGSNPPRSNSGIDFSGKGIIYDVKHIEPFGVFEPLEWLFQS